MGNKMTVSCIIRPKLVIFLILNINYSYYSSDINFWEGELRPPHPPAGALPQTPRLWRGRSLYAFNHNIYVQKPNESVKFHNTPRKAWKWTKAYFWLYLKNLAKCQKSHKKWNNSESTNFSKKKTLLSEIVLEGVMHPT